MGSRPGRRMMAGIEKVLMEEKPDAVLVQGDTNTVPTGALSHRLIGLRIWN
jgi:UDP-N-acetylglucosamine 2-epimerase (non-hydrolysing)